MADFVNGTVEVEEIKPVATEELEGPDFTQETEEEKVCVDEVIARVLESEELKELAAVDDWVPNRMMYLRYARGHNLKVDKTLKKVLGFLTFRKVEEVCKIGSDSYPSVPPLHERSLVLRDSLVEGKPLVYVYAARHDRNNRNIDDYKKYVIHTFERCVAYGGAERLNFVFRMKGFSVWKNMDFEAVKVLVGILQKNYPETLEHAYVCDAPFVFNACWVVIKPWLDPVTAAKVKFVSSSDLPDVFNEKEEEGEGGGEGGGE